MVGVRFSHPLLRKCRVIGTFFDNKKNKSNTEVGKEQYEKGKLDQQLKTILDKLDKIDKKFDMYDKEISERIETALAHHVREYHRKEK